MDNFESHKNTLIGIDIVAIIFALILLISLFNIKETKEKKEEFILPLKENCIKIDTIHIKRATRYNPCTSQCDASPFKTADGSRIIPSKLKNGTQRWVALSRELIWDDYRHKHYPRKGHWRGQFKFGDTITIYSESKPFLNGEWIVHDVLNKRYSSTIDFLTAFGAKPVLGIARDVKIIIKNV